MALRETIHFIHRQEWLQPVEDILQAGVTGAFKAAGPVGGQIKDFLNGVWLGHPLHPALTDVPVGAWTAACVLDALEMVTGNEAFGTGADTSVAVGLAGAMASAVTGLSDWQYLTGPSQRLGVVHGLLNIGVAGLYSASLGLRCSGARGAGRITSLLGYSILTVSADFGGHLVYHDLANVNHVDTEMMPADFTPTMPIDNLQDGKLTRAMAGRTPVVLLRDGNRVYALAETCSHLGGPLSEGTLNDYCVTCPWHGSTFAFEDGRIIHGPATAPQPCFETRVHDGQLEVRLATTSNELG